MDVKVARKKCKKKHPCCTTWVCFQMNDLYVRTEHALKSNVKPVTVTRSILNVQRQISNQLHAGVTRVFFLSLLSRNFDDLLSSNFHKFVILCICWDTPSETFGCWQLPIVSTVFKEKIEVILNNSPVPCDATTSSLYGVSGVFSSSFCDIFTMFPLML